MFWTSIILNKQNKTKQTKQTKQHKQTNITTQTNKQNKQNKQNKTKQTKQTKQHNTTQHNTNKTTQMMNASTVLIYFFLSLFMIYSISLSSSTATQPTDLSPYTPYFNILNQILTSPQYAKGESVVFLDIDTFLSNLRIIKSSFVDDPSHIRIVTKSVPSIPLIGLIMECKIMCDGSNGTRSRELLRFG